MGVSELSFAGRFLLNKKPAPLLEGRPELLVKQCGRANCVGRIVAEDEKESRIWPPFPSYNLVGKQKASKMDAVWNKRTCRSLTELGVEVGLNESRIPVGRCQDDVGQQKYACKCNGRTNQKPPTNPRVFLLWVISPCHGQNLLTIFGQSVTPRHKPQVSSIIIHL